MWVIKFLNGPLTGHIVELKKGGNTVGRSSDCDVVIKHPGVSKKHCKVDVFENEILITDLDSRNGTFVNGLKIKSHSLKPNDKLSFYDIFAELINVTDNSLAFHPMQFLQNQIQNYIPQANSNAALKAQEQPEPSPTDGDDGPKKEQGLHVPQGFQGLLKVAKNYLEEVVLPGVYKLTEWLEFRWVLLLFMAAFIVFVTSLSAIPLIRILKASIEKESQRRALTIARTIARINRPNLMQGLESAVSVELAQREPGVDKAYIISNVDGRIIAPTAMAGKFSDDKFVHTARKEGKEVVGQIDSNTIGALAPIEFYNSNTGTQSITAYAVVIYDMGTLAVDDGRTISLFVQTLFIALIVGAILFFFLYKLIQYPIASINRQLDSALREGSKQVAVNFQFPELQTLISNITSALNRIDSHGEIKSNISPEADRNQEMANLVQLIGFPAIAILGHDHSVAAINTAFEEKTNIHASDILYTPLDSLNDQSLKLSAADLIERVSNTPEQLATNELEFSGVKHELVAQAVMGYDKIAYILIVILPAEEEGQ